MSLSPQLTVTDVLAADRTVINKHSIVYKYREVQEALERQNRNTRGELQGDRRCTAEVHEMNNRGTTEALHRTENI